MIKWRLPILLSSDQLNRNIASFYLLYSLFLNSKRMTP